MGKNTFLIGETWDMGNAGFRGICPFLDLHGTWETMGFDLIYIYLHGQETKRGNQGLPKLVMTNSLLLNMVIEIVNFPIQHGGSFHSYVCHYQRLDLQFSYGFPMVFPWFSWTTYRFTCGPETILVMASPHHVRAQRTTPQCGLEASSNVSR